MDSVYIPARYPNGIASDLAPFEYYEYEKEDAEECIKYAGLILEEVKKLIINRLQVEGVGRGTQRKI